MKLDLTNANFLNGGSLCQCFVQSSDSNNIIRGKCAIDKESLYQCATFSNGGTMIYNSISLLHAWALSTDLSKCCLVPAYKQHTFPTKGVLRSLKKFWIDEYNQGIDEYNVICVNN